MAFDSGILSITNRTLSKAMNMELILAIIIWIAFATATAVVARVGAVKWAEKRGWSALTMPMTYHVVIIVVYLVVVQAAWVVLYAWLIH